MKVHNVKRSEDTPNDPMTELANVALKAIEAADPDARAIVMVSKRDGTKMLAGMGACGYAEDADTVVDMLMNLRAMLQTMGKDLQVIPL